MRANRSADSILEAYAEAIHRLAQAPAQNVVAASGHVTALFCTATRGCPGSPQVAPEAEGGHWRCASCRKPWRIERADLTRGEIGGRVVGVIRDATARGRGLANGMRIRSAPGARGGGPLASRRVAAILGDLGQVLDVVADEDPHAFAAWRLHVLDDEPVRAERSKSIGLELERIPRRMAQLIEGDLLPPTQHDLTIYRVRTWITWARRRALELYVAREWGVKDGGGRGTTHAEGSR